MTGLHVFPDPASTARAAAAAALDALRRALDARGAAGIALSGGSGPRPMFEAMAAARPFDWTAVHFFWVDERVVSPEDSRSNYLLAAESLLRPAGVPEENIHRVKTEMGAEAAAEAYAAEMRAFFGLAGGEAPAFDAMQLGVGADGHTASLFPGDPLVEDRTNLAAAVQGPAEPRSRVTVLPAVIAAASRRLVLVAGAEKAEALERALHGPEDLGKCPAQLLRGSEWFIDEAAARLLPR